GSKSGTSDDRKNMEYAMTRSELLIGGTCQAPRSGSGRLTDVVSPFDGRIVGQVPVAGDVDVEAAVVSASRGAEIWRRTPADERSGQIAQVLSTENGKTLREARAEAGRSGSIIRLAAFEGTQLYGQTLPLDANPGTGLDKVGFTLPQPVGVVVAITPFNYPAL